MKNNLVKATHDFKTGKFSLREAEELYQVQRSDLDLLNYQLFLIEKTKGVYLTN